MFRNASQRRLSSFPFLLRHRFIPRQRLFVLFGIGIGAATGVYFKPSFYSVYADASIDRRRLESRMEDAFLRDIMTRTKSIQISPLERVDIMTLASNNPTEDFCSANVHTFSPTLAFHLYGIYDGHSGTATANILENMLPLTVVSYLADVYSRHAAAADSIDISGGQVYQRNPGEPPDPRPPADEIDDAIKAAFCDIDELIVHDVVQMILRLDKAAYAAIRGAKGFEMTASTVFRAPELGRLGDMSHLNSAIPALLPALSGSCALLGVFNTADRSLRVALTGDSRAVWGRRVPSGSARGSYTYEAQQLTADQNASNADEAVRLTALHPDEPALLKNNRVLGWGCARAFGDGAMKWSLEVQKRLHEDFLGDRPRDVCKTPPYFTAEPVVTTKEGIQPGDFVVYASDGLWDCLETEEVVGLVGKWLEENGIKETVPVSKNDTGHREIMYAPHARSFSSGELVESHSKSTKSFKPSQLPVIYPSDYEDKTTNYKDWREDKEFVCQDLNVAAHLIRNALGGAHTELREALLSMESSRARRFRDDITVIVVFYG